MQKKTSMQVMIWLLALILALPAGLEAQTAEESAVAEGKYKVSQDQLDELLAPIALYPDTLLSQILMAATYPIEIVEADRWLKQNSNLTGDSLDSALKEKPWDVSVKSLCHFPRELAMMSEKLAYTVALGDAFLGQQDQVMDSIQKLRAKAQAAGHLTSTDKQNVTMQDQYISIEPVTPDVIYVPAYDPCWAYGPWWYPVCSPPWFWWPDLVVDVGFFWGPAIFVGPIDFWCGFFWHRHGLFVNVNKTLVVGKIGITRLHGGVEIWQHDPMHRRGVSYRSPATARQFGQTLRPGVEARRAFRGFAPTAGGPGRLEIPRSQPHSEITAPSSRSFQQPRAVSPFEGFGHSGSDVRQHSERGFQSMGSGPRGGGFNSVPGGGQSRSGGFGGGGHHR